MEIIGGKNVPEKSDKELVELVKNGNKDAYDILVGRYDRTIFKYIVSKIRDLNGSHDVLQQSFLQAYLDIGQCREPSKFAGWVFMIANYKCKQWMRFNRRHPTVSIDMNNHKTTDRIVVNSAPDDGNKDTIINAIQNAIGDLSDEQKQVVMLAHFKGMSCKQISESMGKPIGTITCRLSRAYQAIRDNVKNKQLNLSRE